MPEQNDPVSREPRTPEVAAALSGASKEKLDAYLDEQIDVLRLQKEQLKAESALHYSTLRFQRISAGFKVIFELALAFVGIAVAILVALAIWTAANDATLVIEPFSVPADLAQRGVSGQAVALHVLDGLSELKAQTKWLPQLSPYHPNCRRRRITNQFPLHIRSGAR